MQSRLSVDIYGEVNIEHPEKIKSVGSGGNFISDAPNIINIKTKSRKMGRICLTRNQVEAVWRRYR